MSVLGVSFVTILAIGAAAVLLGIAVFGDAVEAYRRRPRSDRPPGCRECGCGRYQFHKAECSGHPLNPAYPRPPCPPLSALNPAEWDAEYEAAMTMYLARLRSGKTLGGLDVKERHAMEHPRAANSGGYFGPTLASWPRGYVAAYCRLDGWFSWRAYDPALDSPWEHPYTGATNNTAGSFT